MKLEFQRSFRELHECQHVNMHSCNVQEGSKFSLRSIFIELHPNFPFNTTNTILQYALRHRSTAFAPRKPRTSDIMPRRPPQTSSIVDNPLSIDARARLATSSVALVTRTFRSGDTQIQYQNKQKHWKAWCQQQKFSTGYVDRPRQP